MAEPEREPVWRVVLAHSRRWGLDLAAVLVLLGLGIYLLPASGTPMANEPQLEVPFWATSSDLLLMGPDAGAWASSAQAVMRGHWEALDEHRLPTYSIVLAAFNWVQGDVALAGHLLNHLSKLLLPLLLFGLGRASGERSSGRAIGLAAGLLVLFCAPLANASRMYGVDPLIAFILPASLLAALSVRHRWWLAGLAGPIAALAMVTHYTTLPMAIPPLLLVLLRGPRVWWKRVLAVLLFAGSGAALLWLLSLAFPFPTPDEFVRAVSEGIAPKAGAAASAQLSGEARTILESGAGSAFDDAIAAVAAALRPARLPWGAMLVLPWLGVLGAGLRPSWREPPERPWLRPLASVDLSLGLVVLAYLAPLPILAAASAPERYGWNLLPFAALLMARGAVSVAACLESGIKLAWARWPAGVLPAVVALAALWATWPQLGPLRSRMPPSPAGFEVRELGELILAHFEPGGGAVCSAREASAIAGRYYCPYSNCPFQAVPREYKRCLGIIGKECSGEGPVPYVVVRPTGHMPHAVLEDNTGAGRDPRKSMDAWLLERYEPLEVYKGHQFSAWILGLPREDLLEQEEPAGRPPGPPNPTPP